MARNRAEAAKRDPVDLSAQPITVNGMGPLRIGMSRQAAERAVGARIPDGTVAAFIAGERSFADPLPCGSD
ncbi:hypothetical protein CP981_02885 [Streptomyces platensis]|nr:hypothetical protein [Streptomyces platensis]QEV50753.1 hypothetical protein CP981_02885 [Streptomyces platensis]